MSKNGFLDIERVYLPKSCAVQAYEWMHSQGKNYKEGVALWAGVQEADSFLIKRTIIPKQTAGSHEDGLIYVVDGTELHRINVELFDSGMRLFAQIHSHPKEAYHSDTDDAFPIVTVLGGVSVVVPNFAKGNINIAEWAVYRYCSETGWTLINRNETFIQLIDDKPELSKTKKNKFWPWG